MRKGIVALYWLREGGRGKGAVIMLHHAVMRCGLSSRDTASAALLRVLFALFAAVSAGRHSLLRSSFPFSRATQGILFLAIEEVSLLLVGTTDFRQCAPTSVIIGGSDDTV